MPTIEVAGFPLAYDDAGATGQRSHRRAGPRRDRRPADVETAERAARSATPCDHVRPARLRRVDRAVLVGCSFGGAVALDATLAHPGRVAGLALLGSAVSGYEFTKLSGVWDTLIGDIDEDDTDLIATAEQMNRAALRSEIALDELVVHDLEPSAVERLGEVTTPTMVLTGAADLAEIPSARRLPDLPGAGHLFPLERPEPVAAALLDFLAELDASPAR